MFRYVINEPLGRAPRESWWLLGFYGSVDFVAHVGIADERFPDLAIHERLRRSPYPWSS